MPLKLADVRALKAVVPDATVNDVILAIVGGTLRTYLSDKGELPKETLTAMAPISVRSESARAALGNQVSAMVVGPEAYAAALRSTFKAMKAAAVKPTPAPPVELNDNKPAARKRAPCSNRGA